MVPTQFLFNPWRSTGSARVAAIDGRAAYAWHRSLTAYAATSLISLPSLAGELGLGGITLKDESTRFGLKAFKGLGASWAIRSIVGEKGDGAGLTFATATDGNHGRAVAWAARVNGARAIVYVPQGTVSARIEAIGGEGAGVIVVDGSYDEATARAAADAAANGWILVQDSAWAGYEEIPRRIMEGYLTLFAEIEEQRIATGAPAPDIVFLQAGVGSFAAAGAEFVRRTWGEAARIVIVEPQAAACLLASAASATGAVTSAPASEGTIMAGLNCGTPSTLAWPILRAETDLFIAIDDEWARRAMRILYHPAGADTRIIAGESGAAGVGALLALRTDPALSDVATRLALNTNAHVLIISTEGDTDPAAFADIVSTAEHNRGA